MGHCPRSFIHSLMLSVLAPLLLLLVLPRLAHGATGRKLFGVYVYDSMGKADIPSGWNNPEELGCDPITNATRRANMLSFLKDPANAIAVTKLPCGPLLKDNATYFPIYASIVEQLSTVGIAVHLMVSDTPDSFMEYQVAFHSAVDALSEAVPSAKVGITYDIEGSSDNAALWKNTYSVMISYAETSKARRPSTWGGFTFWGPFVASDDGMPLYSHATAIEWGNYFAGDHDSIVAALKDTTSFNNTAKLSIGLEMGVEKGIHCDNFIECTGSLMWGRGVDSTKQSSLADWVEQVESVEIGLRQAGSGCSAS